MRLFFCIELDDQTRKRLDKISKTLRERTAARVNWVHQENLHATVKFLGEVEAGRVEELREAVQQALIGIAPSEMVIDRLGVFPNPDRPRVLWVGSETTPQEILQLHDALEAQLEVLGFERDRNRYHFHITLGRVKERSRWKVEALARAIQRFELDTSYPIRVDELALMESTLTREGPIYQPVFRLAFGE
ncbi:MAG: RNA 2',3'-cyclic phosphodiesterase [Candidatus Bipolaricaulia bacterium]